MRKICKTCNEEKELDKFVQQNGIYRNKCKECKNKERRTGKPRKDFPKGHIPWNKGIKERTSKHRIYGPLSDLTKKKISESKKGTICSEESNKKRTDAWLEKGFTFGRRSRTYQKWRKKVLEKDEYKCTKCGSTENLHIHHIIPWKECVEKRMDINNGLTLCVSCHLSLEKKDHIKSEETRKKLSDSLKGRKGSWIGRNHSEESKLKISKSKMGKKIPNYPKNRKSRTKDI